MKLQNCNYNQSKLLKELGFDWQTDAQGLAVYSGETGLSIGQRVIYTPVITEADLDDIRHRVPTVALALKYLRDVHNLYISIRYTLYGIGETYGAFQLQEINDTQMKPFLIRPLDEKYGGCLIGCPKMRLNLLV